jgi:hypothetical protein
MTDKKIIAVVGATGAQGGGLAQAMLNEPTSGFAVRALTRKVGSDKAKELSSHELLGTLLTGERIRPGEEHGPSGEAISSPTCHLVDTGGHQAVGASQR